MKIKIDSEWMVRQIESTGEECIEAGIMEPSIPISKLEEFLTKHTGMLLLVSTEMIDDLQKLIDEAKQ